MFQTLRRPDVLVVTLAAAGILMVTMGVRQSFGLFVSPLNSATGMGVATVSLALAIGQLSWGAIQPVAGALADRYGVRVVLVAGLVGMMTTLLASMRERQREVAILRAVGASPWYLFWLIQLEVLLLTLMAMLGAAGLLVAALWGVQDWLAANYGLFISINPFSWYTLYWAGGILLSAAVLACIPALVAYRRALTDGLNIRL